MTATDDRVWSEFGFVTPERVRDFRAQELAGADLCSCSHFRREHFPDRCAHSILSYSPSPYRRVCGCSGFQDASAVVTPGGQENG